MLKYAFRLKCNERTTHEDEVRTLRRQVQMNQEYRLLIAKQQQEITVRRISRLKSRGIL